MAKKMSDHDVAKLNEVVSSLAKGGATQQYFVTIRRRDPSDPTPKGKLWSLWKVNIPSDELDDVREFCYSVGGDSYEYKINLKDASGKDVLGPDGKIVGPFFIPALTHTPPPPKSPDEDADLVDRARELRRKQREIELERQEAALERERVRLEKAKEKLTEESDEDMEPGSYYAPPWQSPWAPPPPWAQSPWMYAQPKNDTAVELAKAFAPVLAAMVRRPDDGVTLKDVISLIMAEGKTRGFEPKDLIGFVAPLMSEMSKTMGEVNKVAIERMADSDQFWKEKLIEAARLGGAEEDEIDKWRKVLGLATDTVREGAKLVFGRPTIVKEKVEVPVLSRKPVPGIPGPNPQLSEEKKVAPPSQSSPDPAQKALDVARERVNLFLLSHEQEMLIGSDPVAVADKLDELYAMLPGALRAKIESSDTAATYEALREYAAEIVDRILRAVAEDATGGRRNWCEAFWDALKNPSDADDMGNGDEDDNGPEPEPESPAPETEAKREG